MTGIADNLTEDAWRAAYGLAVAFLRDDYDGQASFTKHATRDDLLGIASAAVALATGSLTVTAVQAYGHTDPAEAVVFVEGALELALRTALKGFGSD